MSENPETIAAASEQAASAVVAAAELASQPNEALIDAIVEGAQREVDEAQETAENIARAAMETHLGQQVSALDRRITEWLDGEGRDYRTQLEALQEQVTQLSQQIAATAALALTDQKPSIQQASEQPLTEAAETLEAVLPTTVEIATEPEPVENTPAAPSRRKRLFL